MTLIEYRNAFRDKLSSLYPFPEIDDLFKRCIQHYFLWSPVKIGLEPHYVLTPHERQQLNTSLDALTKGTPLQYILGETHFMGLSLKVNPAVLIPRPETEELVEWVLENHSDQPLQCWDLCSGSGCIALGIKAHRKQWEVKAYELSEAALEVANLNAMQHKITVEFVAQDILQWEPKEEKVDLIVSNPPYVLLKEKVQMHPNVLEHEPQMALFVPEDDPLLFYRKILWLAKACLTPKGHIYLEINPLLVNEMIALGKEEGFAVAKVKKDIFGKDRFIQFSAHDS